jgi:hypothetical protein
MSCELFGPWSCSHLTLGRKVYVSFGGLLLYIEGPYKKLTPLRIDHVYLLLKK